MPNDIFGMAYSSLSPERKMLCAITNELTDAFLMLMENDGERLSKAIIQMQNERTALHVCAAYDRNLMAEHLVKAGADPLAKDLFDLTPLELALVKGNVQLSSFLLATCPGILPQHLWGKGCCTYTEEIQVLLILATPSLFRDFPDVEKYANLVSRSPEKHRNFIKSCYLTGNRIDHKKITDKTFLAWLYDNILKVQDLQSLARIAVRKSMHQNVFYTSSKLCIPKRLQWYLTSLQ